MMLANDWHQLTDNQWLLMAIIIIASCGIAIALERLGGKAK